MAKKSLEEMIAANVVTPEAREATKRLATFLRYWPEIEAAYKKGWSWQQIYRAMFQEGVVDFSYSTFLYYKDKRRRRELEAVKHESETSAGDAKGASERPARTPGSSKGELPVFGQGSVQREPKRF